MTHRRYEPAWLTEATFELDQLIREIQGDTIPDPLGIYEPIEEATTNESD